MINPAPLPSGYYILRGVDDAPALGFRVRDERGSSSLSMFVEPIMVNNHLIAYDSEGGWQETNFSVDDAYTLIGEIIHLVYDDYYDEHSIEGRWYCEDVFDMQSLPFGEFRAVIDPTEELTENYPVIDNPSPVVNGFYVINSEDRLNLDGLCVSVEVEVANASAVNVRIAQLKKQDRYVVYRQGSFDSVTFDSVEVEEFIRNSFSSYVEQSLQETGYSIDNIDFNDIKYVGNLPFAKFFTKLEVD